MQARLPGRGVEDDLVSTAGKYDALDQQFQGLHILSFFRSSCSQSAKISVSDLRQQLELHEDCNSAVYSVLDIYRVIRQDECLHVQGGGLGSYDSGEIRHRNRACRAKKLPIVEIGAKLGISGLKTLRPMGMTRRKSAHISLPPRKIRKTAS